MQIEVDQLSSIVTLCARVSGADLRLVQVLEGLLSPQTAG